METCPKKWILENSTYAEIWERKGYPQPLTKGSVKGIVIHKTLETIVQALTNNNCPSVASSEAHETINMEFSQTAEQQKIIQQFMNVFGNNISGLARIAAKQVLGRFLRKTEITNKCLS